MRADRRDRTSTIERLLVVSERLHNAQHFFIRDEATTMGELIVIDRQREFASFRRQAFVRIGELAALAARSFCTGSVVAAIDERRGGLGNGVHGSSSQNLL